MIMSLFSVMVIFLVLLTEFGTARVSQDVTPIRLGNDRSAIKWIIFVPKPIARFIRNLKDSSSHGNVLQRLEDSELKLSFRTAMWRTALNEIKRLSEKKIPLWHLLRRWNVRPHVEIGPGAFKHGAVDFTPETLGSDMKKLLALQNRQETQAKDLNEGNENDV